MFWGSEFLAGHAHEEECVASIDACVAGRVFENFSTGGCGFALSRLCLGNSEDSGKGTRGCFWHLCGGEKLIASWMPIDERMNGWIVCGPGMPWYNRQFEKNEFVLNWLTWRNRQDVLLGKKSTLLANWFHFCGVTLPIPLFPGSCHSKGKVGKDKHRLLA